eukprot:scaffold31757_cov27-Tisochrysis_lutea.AAC.1
MGTQRDGYVLFRDVVLGSGSFGKVVTAIHSKSGEVVAAKVIDMTKMHPARVANEIVVMSRLRHENVISLLGHQGVGNICILFLELASAGDLYELVSSAGRLEEVTARKHMREILSGVEHLHAMGVVHRDIKLENILVDHNGTCKISDFGLSFVFPRDENGKVVRSYLSDNLCGSRSYNAPETRCASIESHDGEAADVWSIGVCLFSMLTGFFPIDTAESSDWKFCCICEAVLGKGQSLSRTVFALHRLQCHLSAAAIDLLDGMMCLNPLRRLTVSACLFHQWVLGGVRSELLLEPQRSKKRGRAWFHTAGLVDGDSNLGSIAKRFGVVAASAVAA